MDELSELLKNVQWLNGNWRAGWALDWHTVYSVKMPEGRFQTQRTTIGEQLYRLKYRYSESPDSCPEIVSEIVQFLSRKAASFLTTRRIFRYLDAIVPVPPSKSRPFQPVEAIALELGKLIDLPVVTDYLIKVKETPPLKSFDDPLERKELLKGAFKVKDLRFEGKVLLVFDDIYRSGETLTEITRVLYEEGKVRAVYVLTLTKTRVKK